jgi:hypothetical protein
MSNINLNERNTTFTEDKNWFIQRRVILSMSFFGVATNFNAKGAGQCWRICLGISSPVQETSQRHVQCVQLSN